MFNNLKINMSNDEMSLAERVTELAEMVELRTGGSNIYPVDGSYLEALDLFLAEKGVDLPEAIGMEATLSSSNGKFREKQEKIGYAKSIYRIGRKILGKYGERQQGFAIFDGKTALDIISEERASEWSVPLLLLSNVLQTIKPVERSEIARPRSLVRKISGLLNKEGCRETYMSQVAMPFVIADELPRLNEAYEFARDRFGEQEAKSTHQEALNDLLDYLRNSRGSLTNNHDPKKEIAAKVDELIAKHYPEVTYAGYDSLVTDLHQRALRLAQARKNQLPDSYDSFIKSIGRILGARVSQADGQFRLTLHVRYYLNQEESYRVFRIPFDPPGRKADEVVMHLFAQSIEEAQKRDHILRRLQKPTREASITIREVYFK